jgi:hypothetical protein
MMDSACHDVNTDGMRFIFFIKQPSGSSYALKLLDWLRTVRFFERQSTNRGTGASVHMSYGDLVAGARRSDDAFCKSIVQPPTL